LKGWEGCEQIVITNGARYQGFKAELVPVWYFKVEEKIGGLEKWSDA